MSVCAEYGLIIQALVDGELQGPEEDEAIAHLARCSACHQELLELQDVSRRIRLAEPSAAPAELRQRIQAMLQGGAAASRDDRQKRPKLTTPLTRRASAHLGAIAAALIAAVGLVFLFVSLRSEVTARDFVGTAVLEHQNLVAGATPLDIVSDSPDALSTWFAKRVSFPFRMPNSGIAAEDHALYKLRGGRLVSFHGNPVALLCFKIANENISILVGSDRYAGPAHGEVSYSDGIRFYTNDIDRHHVVTWRTRGLTYALISERPMPSRACGACHEGASSATSRAAFVRPTRLSVGRWQVHDGALLEERSKDGSGFAHRTDGVTTGGVPPSRNRDSERERAASYGSSGHETRLP